MGTDARTTNHSGAHPPSQVTDPSGGLRDLAADTPLRTVVVGAVGSLLVMFGSLGVGWLASISPLRQNPLVIWMRYETGGVVLSIVLIAVGSLLLVRQWMRLGSKLAAWGPGTGRWVLAAIAAWSVPMLFSVPLFSRDVYSYIGQGRVVQNGLNPYTNGVSTIENFFQLGADQLWAESPPPYGPVFLWLEQLVVTVTNANPETSILLFRGLCMISVIACMWVIPRLAQLHGVNARRALWLSVANPLFLTNFITAAHNDAIMLALALLGIYVVAVHRTWKGGLIATTLVTLSIGIKPITMVFLPFVGLLWAARGASWPRRLTIWAVTLLYSVGLLALMGAVNGFGFGWVAALSTPGSVFIWYAPIGLLGFVASVLGTSLGANGTSWMGAVHTVGTLLGGLTVLVLMFKGRDAKVIHRLAWAFTAIVLSAPIIQAWYVVWLIPLFAVTGIRTDWQTRALYFLTAFFTVYAVSDQLDVYPYLDLSLFSARVIAASLALTTGIYLWFFDPGVKDALRRTRGNRLGGVVG